jgi:NADPH:quinone reductase-like Zn-dependent oxidoreductase
MKAAVHTSYGPPNVVRVAEVEKPAAKDNQVLVKVHATTVNRTDSALRARAAKPFVNRFFTGLTRPRVTVLGNEFAGGVEAVGRGVTSFEVGDRVFGYNGTRFGTHAEYVAMPDEGSLATMPAPTPGASGLTDGVNSGVSGGRRPPGLGDVASPEGDQGRCQQGQGVAGDQRRRLQS